jgi:hypothetical protein
MNAIDAARNKFLQEKETRMWRHYVLDFGTYHHLSAKVVFNLAGDDENLPRKLVPVKYSHDGMNHKTNTKHFLYFWVARIEDGAQLWGATTNKSTLTASALDELGDDGGF